MLETFSDPTEQVESAQVQERTTQPSMTQAPLVDPPSTTSGLESTRPSAQEMAAQAEGYWRDNLPTAVQAIQQEGENLHEFLVGQAKMILGFYQVNKEQGLEDDLAWEMANQESALYPPRELTPEEQHEMQMELEEETLD